MNIKPIGNRLLTKKIDAEVKTKSGIILDDKVIEKPCIAEIVEVGTGSNVSDFKIGDKILFAKHYGIVVNLEGQKYHILRDDECLAVIYD